MICDKLNINVWELIKLANRHPRVNVLQPGPGVGGHCIAVDPWFIVSKTPEQAQLIRTAREVNDGKPQWVIDKVKIAITDFLQENPGKSIRDVKIACYGLAFKPDIDDLRESPSMLIAEKLVNEHQGEVLLVEPNVNTLPQKLSRQKLMIAAEALEYADIHVLLVDHSAFKLLRPTNRHIVDTKGIWK